MDLSMFDVFDSTEVTEEVLEKKQKHDERLEKKKKKKKEIGNDDGELDEETVSRKKKKVVSYDADGAECFSQPRPEAVEVKEEVTDEVNEAEINTATELTAEQNSVETEELMTEFPNDNIAKYVNMHVEKTCIEVKQISTEGCLHEIALPPNTDYKPIVGEIENPAKTYPFPLDPFQKKAILCIENNESVLVSAHTSSGKTVVAEYSIALALRNNQRVIYTTPIKALSNQKYREFELAFKDVGLVTGDVTLNYEASCLIMTTEILRNMLYRGSEILREVSWVIFDEIHYIRDKERGVVWEETLILLPDNIHSVFLSATIPNARQFAEWVAYLHHQPCHVVYTDVRPVPLEHYIYPVGGTTMHLVVDQYGNFKEDSFNSAMSVISKGGSEKGGNADSSASTPKHRMTVTSGTQCCDIVRLLMKNGYSPMIIFSFSKKECEFYAIQLAKNIKVEENVDAAVCKIFENAIAGLSESDQKLPQVTNLLSFLRKGIGIHHGGLLPILKEVVEILFAEGLLSVLFATETFAMGLNMPAKTVMFTGVKKFDGREMRLITSGEYIQMSGRAGRRGLDEKGTTVLIASEAITPEEVKKVTQGHADHLTSAFHLTYNMILNMMRVEDINPEYMLEKSFHQFQSQTTIPVMFDKIRELEEEQKCLKIPDEMKVAEYYKIRERLSSLGDKFRSFMFSPEVIAEFLQPGRLVRVKEPEDKNQSASSEDKFPQILDWGMVLNFRKKFVRGGDPYLSIDILMGREVNDTSESLIPKVEVIEVKNTDLMEISCLKLKFPKDLRPMDKKIEVYNMIQETKRRFPDGIPLLNPTEDMHIRDEEFKSTVENIRKYEEKLYAHPLSSTPDIENLYIKYKKKITLEKEIKASKEELKNQISSSFLGELKKRKRILRRLGYCTADDIILQKGRVACELSSGQELLLTELIFNGAFNSLTVPQCVALLSCLLCDDKSSQMPKMTEELSGPLKKMQELARRIAQVSNEASLEMDEEQYISSLKPYLMDACYAWSNGATFTEVCATTDIFEGSIIRSLRRMEEMLRQLMQAGRGIGDTDLETKFSEAISSIKRGIVFAASLYL